MAITLQQMTGLLQKQKEEIVSTINTKIDSLNQRIVVLEDFKNHNQQETAEIALKFEELRKLAPTKRIDL